MVYVEVDCRDPRRHREVLDIALREFKRKVKKADIMGDLRKHEFYVPPSKKRKLKSAESLKKMKREEKKAQWHRKNNEI